MPHHRDAIIDLENLEKLSRAELRMLWTEELAGKPQGPSHASEGTAAKSAP
jgi:hypothetical protein